MRGREELNRYHPEVAIRFLEKAVELDSTFAMAHFHLAQTYNWLGNTRARNDAYKKAKTFSKKVTDKERLYIEAGYAITIEQNIEKRFRIFNQLAKKYPNEKQIHFELGLDYWRDELFYEAIEEFNKALELDPNYAGAMIQLPYIYAEIGDYEKAIEYLKRYATVFPGDANPFDCMGSVYFNMGKLDEAIAKFKEALEVEPGFGSNWEIAYIYALKEDYPEAMKWVDQYITMQSSPAQRAEGFLWKGLYYYWLGSLDRSLSELDRAANLWKAVGNEEWVAFAGWMKGWVYYEKGKFELARNCFRRYYDFLIEKLPASMLYHRITNSFYLGLVDLKEGRRDSIKAKLAEMKSLLIGISQDREIYDNLRILQTYDDELAIYEINTTFRYNLLYAEVSLAEDAVEKAIAICEKESLLGKYRAIEWIRSMIHYNAPFLNDVLARAYHQNRELDKSITEYERLITFDPNSKDRRLIHPKYHYRLAKLYEEKDWLSKAIKEYEKFLYFWKDADKNLPELVDAKARLARLVQQK